MTATPHITAGISHFAIKVRDLAAAERFYCDVLGLPVLRRWPTTATTLSSRQEDRAVWLGSGDGQGHGTFLALESASEQPGTVASPAHDTERGGHHLLALRIARVQRGMFESRLAAAGVAVSGRTAYTIYFADPEGNRLGLSHYPDPLPDWGTAPVLPNHPSAASGGTAGGGSPADPGEPT